MGEKVFHFKRFALIVLLPIAMILIPYFMGVAVWEYVIEIPIEEADMVHFAAWLTGALLMMGLIGAVLIPAFIGWCLIKLYKYIYSTKGDKI